MSNLVSGGAGPGVDYQEVKNDAAVICASAIVGLCAAMASKGVEVNLDVEWSGSQDEKQHTKDLAGLKDHMKVVGAIQDVLKRAGLNWRKVGWFAIPAYNLDGETVQAPSFAIMGGRGHREGGAEGFQNSRLSSLARDLIRGMKQAYEGVVLEKGAKLGPEVSGPALKDYAEERGAYYGVVDHPDDPNPGFISSVRRLIPYLGSTGEGLRWNANEKNHGVIKVAPAHAQFGSWDNLEKAITDGIGAGVGAVGYCHGMNWAILRCMTEVKGGTPYEIAVGGTTKLASCIACTTFMDANGYPPSSIHLGRAESWVPLPVTAKENPLGQEALVAAEALNGKWAAATCGYLLTGAQLLNKYSSPSFKTGVAALAGGLASEVTRRSSKKGGELHAANLFLDALTVHDGEVARMLTILQA